MAFQMPREKNLATAWKSNLFIWIQVRGRSMSFMSPSVHIDYSLYLILQADYLTALAVSVNHHLTVNHLNLHLKKH